MADRASVRSAADARQVKRAGQRDRLSQEQQDVDLQAVGSSDVGRRVLWRILVKLNVKDSCWSPDALTMAAMVGQLEVARWLEAECHRVDVEMMLRMRQEAAVTQSNDDLVNASHHAVDPDEE